MEEKETRESKKTQIGEAGWASGRWQTAEWAVPPGSLEWQSRPARICRLGWRGLGYCD